MNAGVGIQGTYSKVMLRGEDTGHPKVRLRGDTGQTKVRLRRDTEHPKVRFRGIQGTPRLGLGEYKVLHG